MSYLHHPTNQTPAATPAKHHLTVNVFCFFWWHRMGHNQHGWTQSCFLEVKKKSQIIIMKKSRIKRRVRVRVRALDSKMLTELRLAGWSCCCGMINSFCSSPGLPAGEVASPLTGRIRSCENWLKKKQKWWAVLFFFSLRRPSCVSLCCRRRRRRLIRREWRCDCADGLSASCPLSPPVTCASGQIDSSQGSPPGRAIYRAC